MLKFLSKICKKFYFSVSEYNLHHIMLINYVNNQLQVSYQLPSKRKGIVDRVTVALSRIYGVYDQC